MTPCRTLCLVPSAIEHRLAMTLHLAADDRLEICGVGVIASAARTMQLLQIHRPERVLLFGIAGGYGEHCEIGSVIQFGRVSIWGVGAGDDQEFITLAQMGLQSLPDDVAKFGDTIVIDSTIDSHLLTVCSAARSSTQVACRAKSFPQVASEDMEGYAVAVACCLASVPLTIIRGISNLAGDRDPAGWKIDASMSNCVEYVNRYLGA